jgi:hypothetical protein
MALNPRRNPLNLIRVMPAKGRKVMAEYIRVLWKHDSPDEPIEMHYEVLEERAVVRMVERFIANADTIEWQKARDPRHVGASQIDGAMLTALQIREETESFTPGEFESYESTPDEFEAAFRRATPMGEKP